MSSVAPVTLVLLLAWGTVVAVDLVTWPQAMLARPLVAGGIAGWLAGDAPTGLALGAIFELFALDVLPVGATRYPDYGPATVAAVTLAAGTAWPARAGLAVLLGLGLAALGGWSMLRLRAANAQALQGKVAALAAGQASAIRGLWWGGITRDVVRGLGLTALGLVLAVALRRVQPMPHAWETVALAVAAGGALAAALGGAVRSAGKGLARRLLVAGLSVGIIAVLVGLGR